MTVAKPKQDSLHENRFVAQKLTDVAELLDQQRANGFRIRAYNDAAGYIAQMDTPLQDIVATDGREGLIDLPNIGTSIARAIEELLETGRLSMIDRLSGAMDPESLFQSVPMIGPHLAGLIHEKLGIETLEDMEAAAHDGRLSELKELGPRRVQGIQLALNDMPRRGRRNPVSANLSMPSVSQILDVDQEYRVEAAAGSLPAIQPKRHNPGGSAWLPVLHTQRGHWHFSVLFSNTARAHRLGRTQDWVVIYFEQDGHGDGQCTVVTEHHGPLAGMRVIRGRERECSLHYGVELMPAKESD